MGAGLFAANLSTSFRLRKFGMSDGAMFGISYLPDDGAGGGQGEQEAAAKAGADEEVSGKRTGMCII